MNSSSSSETVATGPNPSILAVIPARAGSKGIPRKNLARVAGTTLIGHACRVAVSCPSVHRVVITSDDTEMGQEGLRHGAEVFIRRPRNLATDEATAADAWRHAWTAAENALHETFEAAVWLQPTSPTRTVGDVEATIERLLTSGASAAVTISPVPTHFSPFKQLSITEEGELRSIVSEATPNMRRQDVPASYWLNGHCYATRREPFLREGEVLPTDTMPVVIDRPVANIDDLQDLELARFLLGPPSSHEETARWRREGS